MIKAKVNAFNRTSRQSIVVKISSPDLNLPWSWSCRCLFWFKMWLYMIWIRTDLYNLINLFKILLRQFNVFNSAVKHWKLIVLKVVNLWGATIIQKWIWQEIQLLWCLCGKKVIKIFVMYSKLSNHTACDLFFYIQSCFFFFIKGMLLLWSWKVINSIA